MNSTYERLSKYFWWGTATIAILYAFRFIAGVVSSYLATRNAGVDVGWSITDNPQSFIVLCFIAAALSMIILKNLGKRLLGKAVALCLLGFIILRFVFWYISTNQIKINTGLSAIPEANWIGNLLLGAGLVDLIAFLSTLALIMVGVLLLLRRPKATGDDGDDRSHNLRLSHS